MTTIIRLDARVGYDCDVGLIVPCSGAPCSPPVGSLMLISWLALAATVLCSTGGNTFANWSHRFVGRKRLMVLATAVGVHGFGLLCFSVALTGIPLAIAYPVLIGGSVACITLLAVSLFGEQLSGRHFAGLALIIVGMVLLHATGGTTAQAGMNG